MKKWLKVSAISLAVILLIVVLSLVWLANSTSGLNLVLQQLRPMVEAEKIEGNINDLRFSKLTYSQNGTEVKIGSGKLKWQLTSLFSKTITVEQLRLNNIDVDLPATNSDRTSEPINGIELPVNLIVNNVQVNDVSISNAGQSATEINSIEVDGKLLRKTLELQKLKLNLDNAELNAQGKLSLIFKDRLPVDLKLNGFWQQSEQRYQFENAISGTWGKLKLNSKLSEPAMVLTNIELSNPFKSNLKWNAKFDIEQLDSRNWWQDSPFINLLGKIESQGIINVEQGLSSLDALVKTDLTANDQQQQQWKINGLVNTRPDEKSLILESLSIQELSNKEQSNKNGSIQQALNLNAKGIVENFVQLVEKDSASKAQFNLQGDWQHLRWPLIGEKQYASNKGSFTINGEPENYQLKLLADAESATVQNAAVNLLGDCGQRHCDFNQFKVATEHGLLEGETKLVWQPLLQWQTKLKMDKFNPALFLPSNSGEISALLSSHGQQALSDDAKFPFIGELIISDLKGKLGEQAVSGQAKLLADSESLKVNKTRINLGKASLVVSGNIDQNYNLQWKLNAPKLSDFSANTNGALSVNGKLIGELAEPRLALSLSGSKLRSSELKIDKLKANLDAIVNRDLLLENQSLESVKKLDLNLDIANLKQGSEQLVKQSKLTLVGSSAKHTLQASSELSDTQQTEFTLNGQVKNNAWLAQLDKFDINGKSDWRLKTPSKIQWRNSQLNIEPSCVVSAQQSVCLNLDQDSEQTQASLDVSSYQLAQFDRFTQLYGFKLTGTGDAKVRYVKKTSATEPRLEANLVNKDAQLVVLAAQPKNHRAYPISKMKIELAQSNLNKDLNLNTDIQIKDFASLTGQLNGKSTNNINGDFELKLTDLAAIPSPLLGDLRLNGELASNIKVSGSMQKPQLAVNAQVSGAEAEIIPLGVKYRDIQLSLISKAANTVDVKGNLMSGDGKLTIDGVLDFKNIGKPKAQLELNSNNFTLSNTQQIAAVGDLKARLKLDDKLMSIKGSLDLHDADINYHASPSVVLASSDVVLESDQGHQNQQQLELDFKVNLGDKTRFQAMGIDAHLDGELRVEKQPTGIITGLGEIFLKKGAYAAYGQQLVLDKGSFIFSDNSISNPNLSLQATKKVNQTLSGNSDYEAGLRVSGTAELPIIDLYSKPSMSDEDIMSVLIFGKPTSELGPESSLALLRIAASLRGGGSNKFADMTDNLRNDLGLTDLKLNFADGNPNLEMGKQFSKKFYVGYGYGLLNAAQSIIMRYKINQNWSLQGDMGETSGADLHYQIER